MSENELIGTIYSYLLEEFGFGYIDKDLWMIAENLSEKIANEQPQLNQNQQKYLKELQYNRERLGNTHDALFFGLVDYEKRWNLNDEDFAPVLQAFSQWALEQEEE
ncbi:hypothetical protein ACR76W_07755 [Enterococcus casseliflavus]|uniref:hypothetical protein n=1 Tax=Enterococcus casseliflavus TaxID=37734 RepID=UPI003DA43335